MGVSLKERIDSFGEPFKSPCTTAMLRWSLQVHGAVGAAPAAAPPESHELQEAAPCLS